MGIERERFVGNPNNLDILGDDEDMEYFSGDEIEFIPFILQPGDPDLTLHDNLDISDDDDDEDYNPADDYEDFLSDSDFVVYNEETTPDESEVPASAEFLTPIAYVNEAGLPILPNLGAEMCASDNESSPDPSTDNPSEPTKALNDNKSLENKVSGETKTISSHSANEDDTNT